MGVKYTPENLIPMFRKAASMRDEIVVTLRAGFAAGTIEGCLGCEGDIVVQRLRLASAFERFETREGVTVTHPVSSLEGMYRGFWGGVSNRRDRDRARHGCSCTASPTSSAYGGRTREAYWPSLTIVTRRWKHSGVSTS